MFSLSKWTKWRGLLSLAIPVLGGYWLYIYAFNTLGELLLVGALAAGLLVWRVNTYRISKESGGVRRPMALRPAIRAAGEVVSAGKTRGTTVGVVGAGGWD